jgi:hypothetical protein
MNVLNAFLAEVQVLVEVFLRLNDIGHHFHNLLLGFRSRRASGAPLTAKKALMAG